MAPDPRLVSSQALAKAQALELRVNNLANAISPQLPTIMYGSGQTVVTQSAAGSYTWTCPAGVTSAQIECWGAGAGGGGGNSGQGGEGGGGGEYAAEPNYPVVPGTVYSYTVGAGGSGGTTNNAGNSGGNSLFDNGNVFANSGNAGSGEVGGFGATGSSNSITHSGGSGGGTGTAGTGGCGGGGSGGSLGNGANGSTSVGSTGVGGGAGGAGTSGGGGGGGGSGASGVNGLTPGGGGGGAGAATGAGQFSQDWQPTASGTYYGSDATGGNANGFRGNGTMYQGGETASGGSYNGTQKSVAILPSGISTALSGATIDKVQLRLLNLHSWYNSGMYVVLGYAGFTFLGSTWNGSGATGVQNYWVNENVQSVKDLTSTGLGAALKSGAATALTLGPGTPGFNLYNYGYFWGAGTNAGNVPDLHVEWHTGAAPVQAGAGHDGRVQITYGTSGTMTSALQPAASSDAGGNAFAAGYTGPVSTVQPSSSPAAVEGWHDGTSLLSSSPLWQVDTDGRFRYRLRSENEIEIDCFHLYGPSGGAQNNGVVVMASSFPSGYVPAQTIQFPVGCGQLAVPASPNNAGAQGWVGAGKLNVAGVSNSPAKNYVNFCQRIPLD